MWRKRHGAIAVQTITINGRFLTQPLSGVQRFARELTLALDARIAAGTVPEALKGVDWRLAVPDGTAVDLDLQAIRVDAFGRGPGTCGNRQRFTLMPAKADCWASAAAARCCTGARRLSFMT